MAMAIGDFPEQPWNDATGYYQPTQHYNHRLQDVLKESGYFDELPDQDQRQPFYTYNELKSFGLKHIGKNVSISNKCSFYAIEGNIGDNVRIDDFCILKGKIEIGSNVHICAYSMISGAQDVVRLDDFCVLAARCSIYTGSNDHAADALPAPLAPKEYTKQRFGPVRIGLGVMVGAHVVILPGVSLGEGSSVGAGCVVSQSIQNGEMLRGPKSAVAKRIRNYNRIKEFAVRVLENVQPNYNGD